MAGILILTAAFDVQFVECQSKKFCTGGKKLKQFAKDGLLRDYIIFAIKLTNQLVEHSHSVFVTKLFLL